MVDLKTKWMFKLSDSGLVPRNLSLVQISLMNIWSKSLTDCMKIGMPNSVISQSVLMGIVGIILMITMVTNCNTCYAYAVLFLQLLSIMEWCLCNCLKHVCHFLHSLVSASLCCLGESNRDGSENAPAPF